MTDALRIADQYRVAAITNRRINHADYWSVLQPSLVSPRLHVEVDREVDDGARAARDHVRNGSDEGAALVADARRRSDRDDGARRHPRVDDRVRQRRHPRCGWRVAHRRDDPDAQSQWGRAFQRENAVGVDINRDARRLSTSEAKTLKAVHDRFKPDFGFNLHDQNARTRVDARVRRQRSHCSHQPPTRLAVGDRLALGRDWSPRACVRDFDSQLPGRVSKYDDAFNPRAFGDLMGSVGHEHDPDRERRDA